MTLRLVYIVGLLLLTACTSGAGVVVNEVLSNEPGGTTSLEWIELYNDSPDSVRLDFYGLEVMSGSMALAGWLDANGYLVICRDSVRFEEHFGDSSGIWGDDDSETGYSIEQHTFPILTNSSGHVNLVLIPNVSSSLEWTESGDDGVSWERKHPESDVVLASVDATGSTPGRINSVTPLPHDLALEAVLPSAENGATRIAFTIANRGTTTVADGSLSLRYYDVSAPGGLGDLIATEAIGSLDTGFTVILVSQYQLSATYNDLVAVLEDDDRLTNNRMDFTAPGGDYPPLVLSEILPNPTGALNSEWVELKNVSEQPVDLAGWQLGDLISLVEVSAGTLIVPPGDYIVLTDDAFVFNGFYSDFAGVVHEPNQWPSLNNAGDIVRLVDSYGIEADRFSYETGFDNNHTWSRGETEDRRNDWGRSEDEGGTPGEVNRVRFSTDNQSDLEVTISPRVFSPNGDGYEDSTVIAIQAPEADEYTLRLYDSQGRLVRTLEKDATDLPESYSWHGNDNSGQRLPIGIYILHFEASGVESIKKTIVIAR